MPSSPGTPATPTVEVMVSYLAPAVSRALTEVGLVPGGVLLVSSGWIVYEVAQFDLEPIPGVLVVPTVGGNDQPEGWYQTNETTRLISGKARRPPELSFARFRWASSWRSATRRSRRTSPGASGILQPARHPPCHRTTTVGEQVNSIRIDGKRVLITGAARGIGADLAETFAAAGAALVLSGRDQGALAAQARELRQRFDVRAEAVAADLSEPDAPAHLAAAAAATFGGLDVLINNAGIASPQPVTDLTAETFDEVLTVNLRAPALLAATVGTAMAQNGGGSIVTVASDRRPARAARALRLQHGKGRPADGDESDLRWNWAREECAPTRSAPPWY